MCELSSETATGDGCPFDHGASALIASSSDMANARLHVRAAADRHKEPASSLPLMLRKNHVPEQMKLDLALNMKLLCIQSSLTGWV